MTLNTSSNNPDGGGGENSSLTFSRSEVSLSMSESPIGFKESWFALEDPAFDTKKGTTE